MGMFLRGYQSLGTAAGNYQLSKSIKVIKTIIWKRLQNYLLWYRLYIWLLWYRNIIWLSWYRGTTIETINYATRKKSSIRIDTFWYFQNNPFSLKFASF